MRFTDKELASFLLETADVDGTNVKCTITINDNTDMDEMGAETLMYIPYNQSINKDAKIKHDGYTYNIGTRKDMKNGMHQIELFEIQDGSTS